MNKEMKEILDMLKELKSKEITTEQVNKELKEINENLLRYVSELILYIDDYKSRFEKASEYIDKQKKKMYKSRNKIAIFILMKLENILQNQL